jgi:Helix-turn-helix domain
MTAPAPSPAPAGSVLDGDPRILIPLPEAAERLGISRWQAYKLARSGRLPTTRLGRSGSACPGGGVAPYRARRPPPSPGGRG